MATITINISEHQLQSLKSGGQIVINIGNQEEMPSEQKRGDDDFIEYIDQQARNLRKTGNLRTSETYLSAKNQLMRFQAGKPLPMKDVNTALMEQFQSYMRSRNLTMNSISFNMRILRAAYNRAVRQGLVADARPFHLVYTGQDKTLKRALTLEQMRQIAGLEIADSHLLFARDMFMLSFYLRGIAFVDMSYLRLNDLRDGVLTYKRRKTGQKLTVGWEKPMQTIVDRYHDPKSPFLLPIVSKENGKERNQYRHRQTQVNVWLKEVARLAGIKQNLTMYCARHTWATTARELQVPMNIICHAMGHANERTTEIYIQSVDSSSVDSANKQILKILNP